LSTSGVGIGAREVEKKIREMEIVREIDDDVGLVGRICALPSNYATLLAALVVSTSSLSSDCDALDMRQSSVFPGDGSRSAVRASLVLFARPLSD